MASGASAVPRSSPGASNSSRRVGATAARLSSQAQQLRNVAGDAAGRGNLPGSLRGTAGSTGKNAVGTPGGAAGPKKSCGRSAALPEETGAVPGEVADVASETGGGVLN